jgi:selenocysteine-specific elongation factor
MLYIGSREIPVALHPIGATSIHGGASGCIRVTLPVSLPIAPGDRYILRESGRDETIGGGQVLDIQPIVRTSKATPNNDVLRLVAERGWVQLSQLHLLAGRIVDISEVEQVLDGWVTTNENLNTVKTELSTQITASKDLGLDVAKLSPHQRLALSTIPNITVRDGRLDKGMQSFGTNLQVMSNIDHLYAYLKGRSDGAIVRAKVELTP